MLKIFCVAISLLCIQVANGQLTVDNTTTPEEAVEALLGQGITVSNVTFSGDLNQIGLFTCAGCGVTLEDGVILASGDVVVAEGPNDSGSATEGGGNFGSSDPDLNQVEDDINDLVVLEFDFIPTGDSVKFNYVWASEEYPEFSNSSFNDVFGFFLSGPGLNGPYTNDGVNIAEIPGSGGLAVTINNLNNGFDGVSGPCEFCEFYVHNSDNNDPNGVQFDGYTVVLTAKSAVQCGETYHIKIALADAGDSSFDSAVFLEGGSFTSELIELDLDIATVGVNDSTVYEGCGISEFVFTRPENNSDATAVDLTVTGSAENGVDYETLPAQIFFPQDVYEVSIPFETFEDDLMEGTEVITITFATQLECTGASIESTYNFYIQDPEPLSVESPPIDSDCGLPVSLEPLISGGYGLYNVEWEDDIFALPLDTFFYETTTLNYTVTDTCGAVPVDGQITVNIPDYPPIMVDLGSDQEIDCLSDLIIDPTVTGGNEVYEYTWLNNDGDTLGNSPNLNMPGIDVGPGTVTLVVHDECINEGADSMEVSFPPVPVTVDLGIDLSATCLDTNLIDPEVSGGIGDYSYEWYQDGAFLSDTTQVEINTEETTEISLIVEDQCGNVGEDQMIIDIPDDPIELITHNDTLICYQDSIHLFAFAVGGQGGYSYLWQPLYAEDTTQISDRPLETTTYSIYAVDVCGNETEAEILVQVERVIANFDYEDEGNWGLNFSNASNIDGEYLWDFGDGNTSTEENPTHFYYDLFPHTVTLHVTTENTCSDSASITYHPDMNLYIPNAFTPNSDGINDVWKVEGHDVAEFELRIYNRWGRLVFLTRSIDQAWDGSHLGGDHYVQDEVYTYRLTATGIAGNTIEKTGSIMVFR